MVDVTDYLGLSRDETALPGRLPLARRARGVPAGIQPVAAAGRERALAGSRTAHAAACKTARVRSAAGWPALDRQERQPAVGAQCGLAAHRRAERTSAVALAPAPRLPQS
jgi:hypothetical protein